MEVSFQRIGRMIYLAKGPKMVHKKHLNQTKIRHIDEENDISVDVEPMEVFGTQCECSKGHLMRNRRVPFSTLLSFD